MKDPTANAAIRNVAGGDRAAVINYREDGYPARLWMDRAAFRTLAKLVVVITDDTGERHIRFKEEAADLLEQSDGQAPKEGAN